MNSPQPSADKSDSSPVSKAALGVMIIVVAALGFLALFANVQHFRAGQIETVTVRTASSPTPNAR